MKTAMQELDEKGFVFIDALNKPYLIRMYCNQPWLFYWSEGWVTLRKVGQMEIWESYFMAIPDDQAEVYRSKHEKLHS